jgi:hypothetical protein
MGGWYVVVLRFPCGDLQVQVFAESGSDAIQQVRQSHHADCIDASSVSAKPMATHSIQGREHLS